MFNVEKRVCCHSSRSVVSGDSGYYLPTLIKASLSHSFQTTELKIKNNFSGWPGHHDVTTPQLIQFAGGVSQHSREALTPDERQHALDQKQ